MKINPLVIDLSHWDDVIDYGLVKAAGVVGVFYKASQGTHMVDSTYAAERKRAEAAGLLWGAYHFGDSSDPVQQVKHFLSAALPSVDTAVALDYENLSTGQMSIDQAKAFVIELEAELGIPNGCIIYSGNLIKETLPAKDVEFWGARRLWLAQYSSSPVLPSAWDKYWLWQYTDGREGLPPHTVQGVRGVLDMNHYDGTRDQLIKDWTDGRNPKPEVPGTLDQVTTLNAEISRLKLALTQAQAIITDALR